MPAVLDHVGLAVPEEVLAELARTLRFPSYYEPRFTAEELATLERHTAATAWRFGYDAPGAAELSASA